ncbi:uncharacterized protein VDAG_01920 [Verticillium dahliae VdLs.17]|uniref:Nudix hydrolase domain-containing protein n=2 Tax=Verticillium dahliae TaxID=27337 RepID=G2WWD4_VERDV|nr:uncharacterized protein VDAG_01920 [Verticillium dahliae VdLs.17]EGY19904.1 hypothetical protein VDAG_01920 [Verticillium dahliae VdLs.17]
MGEESLLACAVRETLEETGVRVTPLAVRCGTRATPGEGALEGQQQQQEQQQEQQQQQQELQEMHEAQHMQAMQAMQRRARGAHVDLQAVESDAEGPVRQGLTEGVDHYEAVACCHWADAATGALKMVFYYAASADESALPEPLMGEDAGLFENVWCKVDEAAAQLAFPTDGMVVNKAVADMRRTGYDI